ncbi:MAG: hypothetical protein ACI9EF_003297, partial [Pseudohongiellaceae bacterium]
MLTSAPRSLRLALLALLLVWGGFSVDRAMRGSNDFDGFHQGAATVWEHGELLHDKAVSRYPPTFQVLLAPFGALPIGWAAAYWYLLSLAALLALPRELARLTGVSPSEQGFAWLIVAPLVLNDLSLGQSGIVLLWAMAFACVRAREGKGLRGGAVLGLCAAFKLLPATLLAVPLVMGRFARSAPGFALGVAAACVAALALLGSESTLDAFDWWLLRNTDGQTPWALVEQGRSMRFNNQALCTVLARTFGDIGNSDAPGAVRLASWPLHTIWWIYGTIAGAIAALGLWAAVACRRLGGDKGWGGLFALSCLTMLLAAPLVWTHYFFWVLPALVVTPLSRRARTIYGSAFVLCLASESLRGLGAHLWLSLALFVVLARGV